MRLVLICMLFVFPLTGRAQIPPLINYQGHIASATSLTNPISVVFSIYPSLEGGQALWSETHNITHNQGAFSV